MKSIILASILGLAFAASPILEHYFEPKTEYHYHFNGLILSGLPTNQQSQYAQSRIHARVSFQTVEENVLHFQLIDVEMSASNEEQSNWKYPKLSSFEERTIPEEYKTLLYLPVRAVFEDGVVSRILFEKKDVEWSKNIKRSIVNMISFYDVTPNEEIESLVENDEFQSFVTNETTIEGDCQIAYTINKEHGNKRFVTKTVDFYKCLSRDQFVYGNQFSEKTDQAEEQHLDSLTPQTVYKYILENDLLTGVEVCSIYSQKLRNREVMKTDIRSKLKYAGKNSYNNEITLDDIAKAEDIMYSTKWEELVEDFYKYGDDPEVENPFDNVSTENKMSLLEEIFEKIHDDYNDQETVHQLARLVNLLRTCTIKELAAIYDKYSTAEFNKKKSMIDQALAIAGTKNTIEHLLKDLKRQNNPIKAALLMKLIQETPYPSEDIAKLVFDFGAMNKDPLELQSSGLALGVIARGTISQNQNGNEKTLEIKQEFLRMFMESFKDADTTYLKILILKSLGNAGIDLSINPIIEIIKDHSQPVIVRREAVDSLRLLDNIMPYKIQRTLLPIYMNRKYAPELRMTVLWRLIQTRPSSSILFQIVSQIEKESNQQVRKFTYEVLKKFSESTNPQFKQLAKDCESVLSYTRFTPEQFKNAKSEYRQLSLFASDLLSGVQLDSSAIFSKNDIFPAEYQISLQSIFGENWNKYLLQFGFSQERLEKALFETRSAYRHHDENKNNIKNVAKQLNLKAREYERNEEEGDAMAYWRFKNIDYVIVPFARQEVYNIEYVTRKYTRESFARQVGFTQTAYFYEKIHQVPTSLGIPLVISGKTPSIASFKGTFNYEIKNRQKRIANMNVIPSIVSTHIFEMRMMTPLFDQGIKLLKSVRLHTPINFNVVFISDSYGGGFEAKINIPQNESVSIELSNRPVVFLRYDELEEKTLTNLQWARNTHNWENTQNALGLEILTRGNVLKDWNYWNILHTEQDYEIVIKNLDEKPAEFTMASKLFYAEPRNYNFEIDDEFKKEFNLGDESIEEKFALNELVRSLSRRKVVKTEIEFNVSAPDNHKIDLKWGLVFDKSLLFFKTEFDAVLSNKKDWRFNNQFVLLTPKLIHSIQDYKNTVHREILVRNNMVWGPSEDWDNKNQIKLNAQLGQSSSQRNSQQNRESHVIKASQLNQLDIVVQYKFNDQTQPRYQKLVDRSNQYFNQYWPDTIEQQENQENHYHLRIVADPITRQYVNISFATPEQQLSIYNYETPKFELITFNRMIHQNENHVCTVSPKKVQTFDEMTYSAPLTTCYSVIAKDCSENPTFAVLAKKKSKTSNNLIVKFYNSNDVFVISKNDNDFVVEKNGVVLLEHQLEYLFEIKGEQLFVEDKNIRIRFNGQRIQTKYISSLDFPLCGLCGNNDNEMDNELQTAQDKEAKDIEDFHRSYILDDDECEIEEDVVSDKRNYQDIQKNDEDSYEEEDDEVQENEDSENHLYWRTEIREFAHRVCFSLQTVRTCLSGFEEEQTVQQEVEFTCLPRHTTETRALMSKSRQQDILELENYPVSFTDTVTVPTHCEQN